MPKVTIKNVSCAAPTVQAAKIVKYKQEGSSSAAVVQAAPKKKRVRTGPLLYCDIPGCTYASIHRQNLTRHKAGKHNINVTWYSCDLCPYRAKQRSDLKDHKAAVHFIDVVWLPCTEPGCSYRAKRKRALTEHLADRQHRQRLQRTVQPVRQRHPCVELPAEDHPADLPGRQAARQPGHRQRGS